MFGFELLFATIKCNLKSKNDLLVSVIHFNCIRNGFLCLGNGENFGESGQSEPGSELMPDQWNQSEDTYILRYFNQKLNQKLLVKCVKVSDILILSALLINGESNGSTHSLRTDDYITDNFSTFKSAFVSGSVDTVSQIIEREVINKVIQTVPKTTVTKRDRNTRSPDRQENDPLRVRPNNPGVPPNYGGARFDPLYGGQPWPPPIGGADLDPLGRAQGGMLMDPYNFPQPFGQPRNPGPELPRGAVPPGARFDPFGPLGVGPNPRPNQNRRQMGPDPDHLPPPGYNDMFM